MARNPSGKLVAGSAVRVVPGMTMPEFQDVDISGWTGAVAEVRGRGADQKFFIEWDAATLARMPEAYRDHCERNNLYHGMVCLSAGQIEPGA